MTTVSRMIPPLLRYTVVFLLLIVLVCLVFCSSSLANTMSAYAKAFDLVIRFPLNFDIWAPPRQHRPGRYMTILDPLSELPVSPTSLPASLSTSVLRDAPHFVDINLDDDIPTQSPVQVLLTRVSGFLRRVFRVKMDA